MGERIVMILSFNYGRTLEGTLQPLALALSIHATSFWSLLQSFLEEFHDSVNSNYTVLTSSFKYTLEINNRDECSGWVVIQGIL